MKSSVNNARNKLINNNNELDFLVLFHILWDKKWFIVLMTGIGAIIGTTLIKLLHPIYEAKVIISPPALSEIENFNVGRTISNYTLLKPFKRIDIYNLLKEHLRSESTKSDLFTYLSQHSPTKEKNNKSSEITLNNSFLPIVSTGALEKGSLGKQFVSVKYTDVKHAAGLVMKYVEIANQNALNELLNTIKIQNNSVVTELESRVNAAQLTESNQMDSNKNLFSQVQNDKIDKEKLNNLKNTNLNDQNNFKGDLSSLKSDFSQLAYASRVREMQENIELYKKIKINDTAFLYRIDGELSAPAVAISPHKGAILLLSTILGLIVGITLVLLKVILAERQIFT